MIPLFIKSIKEKTYTPTVKESSPKKESAKKPEKKAKEPEQPNMQNFTDLLGMLKDRGAGGTFGEHNVEAGHHVAFAAGKYTGSGKVTATGRDGLTVEDETKREHRVHWHEVSGHFAPEKPDKKATDAK